MSLHPTLLLITGIVCSRSIYLCHSDLISGCSHCLPCISGILASIVIHFRVERCFASSRLSTNVFHCYCYSEPSWYIYAIQGTDRHHGWKSFRQLFIPIHWYKSNLIAFWDVWAVPRWVWGAQVKHRRRASVGPEIVVHGNGVEVRLWS